MHVAVCSWSLQPTSPSDLADKVRACGLSAVQLALDPLRSGAWDRAACRQVLADSGVRVLSGMMGMVGEDYSTLESIRRTGGVRPDAHWEANLAAAHATADLAAGLGLGLVTLHAGFLPHDPADPERVTMLGRVAAVARAFGERGVSVGLETGQESAETLAAVLEELACDNVGVNFDPANMVLYGMGDPLAALERLAPSILQVHIKDALPAWTPGTWGSEVPVGEGAVDWAAFLGILERCEVACDLVIEREAGDDRIADVATARGVVDGLRARRGT